MNTENLFQEMQKVLFPYLCKDLTHTNAVYVSLEKVYAKDWDTNADAFTEYLGRHDSILFFEISYKASLARNKNAFMTMIAHELVHVFQHIRGDEFNYSLPYEQQPHEIEAYALEDKLVEYYLKETKKC